MRALVFAAGLPGSDENVEKNRQEDDIIIAANGGTRFCLSLGIVPDIVIGDFDSITQADFRRLSESGTQIIRYSPHKDFTDLELALQHACTLNVSEILVFGSLGLRWDHTLANIILLASPSLDCKKIRLMDGNQEIFLISNKNPAQIYGNPGDTVSLIPIGGDVCGIKTSNLEYPLNMETLYFGASRGVSNVMIQPCASVSLTDGMLVCIVVHQ